MKKKLISVLKQFISPSVRLKLRQLIAYLKELANKMCLWRWQIVKLPHFNESCQHNIFYVGRKDHREQAKALLGIDGAIDTVKKSSKPWSQLVVVSEIVTPGALCVPRTLSTIVPLGRPQEEILASYDSELRRLINKQRINYSSRHALDSADIKRIDAVMLKPYATARHDNGAVQLKIETVCKMANPHFGRLDVILLDNEEVACHLGCILNRDGKRYWSTVRFGYPEAVFSDRKRLREVNAMTTFLAQEWALENDFDYYDIGMSLARPDGGLLQWKRRRKGALDTLGNDGYFYVRLPKLGAAQFLWSAPLFSVEDGCLTLHLGIPTDKSDTEIAARYREMGYCGLSKVYLYSKQVLSDALLEKILGLYLSQKTSPIIQHVLAN